MSKGKLTLKVPGVPKGQKLHVPHLGLFENGKTHDLTEEQVFRFTQRNPLPFPEGGHLYIPLDTDPNFKPKTPTGADAEKEQEEPITTEPTSAANSAVDVNVTSEEG